MRQQTDEWFQARLGWVTASRFKDVIAQPRSKADREAGKLSASARGYLYQVVAEKMTGERCSSFSGSAATEHGNEWEAEARQKCCELLYETTGHRILEPEGDLAFWRHPSREYIGFSPDGVIDDGEGLCEIQCPYNAAKSIQTRAEGWDVSGKTAQIQGGLWVSGRKYFQFVSYDPRLVGQELYTDRVERDEAYIEMLSACVIAFRDQVIKLHEELSGVIF